MHATARTALGRLMALMMTGALALMATVALSSSVSAEDLENTSDDVIADIEAQDWPEYGLGDQHPDIAAAKYLLQEVGFDPHLSEDAPSEFDGKMEASVSAFQNSRGLEDTGRLDQDTWAALSGEVFGEWGVGSSSGDAVKAIQFLLNAKFYAHHEVDGEYTDLTAGAVTEAQEYFDIAADGIVGPITWRALVTYDDYDR
ncbi:peptidoglycan-binding protein [Nocardiopsis sp. HNM0947]|uniref:Peptidoglycan-binding protein n=1 Tax=Nocardiopsis coralli TaxID=2772213 RepID=A0ABR9P0F0_9ACTN|nr:peptidoglycan-binding protein [Nocardiopsis coralli]MBE2997312.1 peptidoglycan-binding protein [Nocardiopsis coralli]